MKKLTARITTFEPMLGSAPSVKEIYREFIASKAPDASTIEDEVASLGSDAVADKGTTVFPRDEGGNPFIWDYQIKGMFKDACQMLARVGGKDPETGKKIKTANESSKLTAYKKIIDGLIFVSPRRIPIAYDGEIGICERPLRAQTAQGERVALASSEQIEAGAVITFDVICLNDDHVKAVREWLDYGFLRGLGQWRNSGMGRFTWEELACEDISARELSGRRGA